jgi:uncharacterized protein (TIGR02265 family)
MSAPAGFLAPDDSRPLDVEEVVRETPADAAVRGMFFNTYLAEAKRRGVSLSDPGSYVGFKFYPLHQWQRFIVDVAARLHPGLPLRGALRQVGLSAYPTFADSIVGRVVFGVLGKDLGRILRVASKGFEHSLNSAHVELVSGDERSVRLHLAGVYGFIDSYNVGVFEGAFKACDREGSVFYRSIAPGEAEIICQWT